MLRRILAATIVGFAVSALLSPGVANAAEKSARTAGAGLAIPATDDGLAGSGSIRRDERFQSHWRDRRASWAGRTAQDRNAIVFVGDATVERWTGLGAAFPGMKIANRGIEGDTTRGVLFRLQQDVVALDPKAVVLLVGASDVELGVTPQQAASNLQLILAALEKQSAKVPIVVCQVLPRSDALAKPADDIKALNAAYLDVVRNRPNVTYVETWVQLADAKGNATAQDFADLLHPTQAGFQKLGAALRPVFSTLGLLTESTARFTPDPGFVNLFNERDLTGWGFRPTPAGDIESAKKRDATNPRPPVRFYSEKAVSFDRVAVTPEGRYLAKNGNLVVTTPPEYRKIQQLWTTREFPQNFVLKLEFRATPNADSGVYIRGPQLQVRDYLVAGPYNQLKRYRPQEWNQIEITVNGTEAVCTCNGEVLEANFKVPMTGPIGLEGDRGQVEYRRIQLKILP